MFNYMLEIDIFRNSSQKVLGVLKGDICGFGCPNDTQTSCWLILWPSPLISGCQREKSNSIKQQGMKVQI